MCNSTPDRIAILRFTLVGGYCWGAAPRASKNEVVTLCARHTAVDAFSQLLLHERTTILTCWNKGVGSTATESRCYIADL
jgi:hypothetical protein